MAEHARKPIDKDQAEDSARRIPEKVEGALRDLESRLESVEAGMRELRGAFETESVEVNRRMTERFENISDRIDTKTNKVAQQVQELRGELEGLIETVDSVRPHTPEPAKKEDDK